MLLVTCNGHTLVIPCNINEFGHTLKLGATGHGISRLVKGVFG
jgi:hypothetical protein